MDVGALVAGQRLEQPLAECAEEPLDGGLVRRGVGPCRLDGDPQAGAHAHQMVGQVDPPVVDHDRLGVDAGEAGTLDPVGVRQHHGRHPLVGEDPRARRAATVGRDGLIEHQRSVDRLGRHRRQPEAGDAAGAEVQGDRQLDRHPAQGQGLHGEDVQGRGVQQQVLARPGRPQPAIGAGRAPGDRALLLGGAAEGVGATGQLRQRLIGPRAARDGDAAGAVGLVEAGRNPLQEDLVSRAAGVDVLVEYRPAGVDPALVQAPKRIGFTEVATVEQTGGPVGLEGGQPTLHRAHPHTQLVRLGPLAV